MMNMILVTHAVAGGATALLFKHDPLLAFGIGFASHFLLDAIPHWHYPLSSFVRDPRATNGYKFLWSTKRFLFDVIKTGIDCGMGLTIAWIAIQHSDPGASLAILTGAVGGVFPDFLQLVYYRFPTSPIRHIQRFHHWIHAKRRLDSEPLLGISTQGALLAFTALLLWYS